MPGRWRPCCANPGSAVSRCARCSTSLTHEVNLAVEEFFADREPDDLLLVHFSCHGVKDEDGELYFATPNTELAGWPRPRWRPTSSTGG